VNSYAYFDGVLTSSLPLPELLPGHSEGNSLAMRIQAGKLPDHLKSPLLHAWTDSKGTVELELRGGNSCYRLTAPGIVSTEIDYTTNRLTVMALCDDEAMLRGQLLDQILPRIMCETSQLVLHASCVTKGGTTIAFTGDSGAGKSTLAAYFQVLGWKLIADDCLKISVSDNEVSVCGAYPGLKLFADSSERLSSVHAVQLPTARHTDKRRTRQTTQQLTGHSLNAIILLDPGASTLQIEQRRGADVLLEVFGQTFALNPGDLKATSDRLQDARRLLETIPYSLTLSYLHNYDALPGIADKLLKYFR